MKKKRHSEVIFKSYNQDQLSFLPPSLDELIPVDHPVRTVNRIVDRIDLSPIIETYGTGGTSSYHPAMLLKVILYSYLRNIYSTRKMEEALTENIHFMWLAANNRPDHNTLARFRSQRLKKHVETIFSQTVHLLVDAGLVSLKEAFVDGTKIEANANKYTFVWGKSIEYNKKKISEQLNELTAYAESVAKGEESLGRVDFEEISAEKVDEAIDKINATLQGKEEVDRKVKSKLRYAKKNWPKNLEKYDQQEETLNGRRSYSKTDTDASFMRMKDDHMKNGQLKPGYNLQVSTENQFVTNVTVHQSSTDPNTLKDHLNAYSEKHDILPEKLTADAGYGSNENYTFLDEVGIEAFVKFPGFHHEKRSKKSFLKPELWDYDDENDCFSCPNGKKMRFLFKGKRLTSTGFEQQYSKYESESCIDCPFKDDCCPQYNQKIFEINHSLREQRQRAREKLNSEEGLEMRLRRCWEVETYFGDLKENRNFKRFNLRGMMNVLLESILMAMAYNIRKMPA